MVRLRSGHLVKKDGKLRLDFFLKKKEVPDVVNIDMALPPEQQL
jgi:hypothetical protein